MAFPKLSPKQKKSFTYSFFILAVISVFFLGYFYYFIPKNEDTIHRNGFIILKSIASNVTGKQESHMNRFTNLFKNGVDSSDMMELLKEN